MSLKPYELKELFETAGYPLPLIWTCREWRSVYLSENWPQVLFQGQTPASMEHPLFHRKGKLLLTMTLLAQSGDLVTTPDETFCLLTLVGGRITTSVEEKTTFASAYSKLVRRGLLLGFSADKWRTCVWQATTKANVEALHLLLEHGIFQLLPKGESLELLFLSVVFQPDVERGIECVACVLRHFKDFVFTGAALQSICAHGKWDPAGKSKLLVVLLTHTNFHPQL